MGGHGGGQDGRGDEHLIEAIEGLAAGPAGGPSAPPAGEQPIRAGSRLTVARCLELFDAQVASRHLDEAARWLRGRGTGFYTIGSSGHEANAAIVAATRLSDP